MRSASLGPPKRELSASGLRCLLEGGAVSRSLAVVVEFSTLHFRSSLSPGSMVYFEEVLFLLKVGLYSGVIERDLRLRRLKIFGS